MQTLCKSTVKWISTIHFQINNAAPVSNQILAQGWASNPCREGERDENLHCRVLRATNTLLVQVAVATLGSLTIVCLGKTVNRFHIVANVRCQPLHIVCDSASVFNKTCCHCRGFCLRREVITGSAARCLQWADRTEDILGYHQTPSKWTTSNKLCH